MARKYNISVHNLTATTASATDVLDAIYAYALAGNFDHWQLVSGAGSTVAGIGLEPISASYDAQYSLRLQSGASIDAAILVQCCPVGGMTAAGNSTTAPTWADATTVSPEQDLADLTHATNDGDFQIWETEDAMILLFKRASGSKLTEAVGIGRHELYVGDSPGSPLWGLYGNELAFGSSGSGDWWSTSASSPSLVWLGGTVWVRPTHSFPVLSSVTQTADVGGRKTPLPLFCNHLDVDGSRDRFYASKLKYFRGAPEAEAREPGDRRGATLADEDSIIWVESNASSTTRFVLYWQSDIDPLFTN